jgi:carbon-monoxide dehydrogenase medium subunit
MRPAPARHRSRRRDDQAVIIVRPFNYVRPATVDEALRILSENAASTRCLAGGTDLIVRMRMGHLRPETVVDLKRVSGLSAAIDVHDGSVRVGAGATMTSLVAHPLVRRHFPALIEAASVVGSIQIRNRATLAGNICNASPAADTVPPLLVYEAMVHLLSSRGPRTVALRDFFVGPGRTVKAPDELLTSVALPIPPVPAGAAFGRVTRRRGVDLATVNLCGLVTSRGEARFAFGAVAPTAFVTTDATGALGDRMVDSDDRDHALRQLWSAARPITDVRGGADYRSAMLEVMTRRVWARAVAVLRERASGDEA